jgi:hypothetical protein
VFDAKCGGAQICGEKSDHQIGQQLYLCFLPIWSVAGTRKVSSHGCSDLMLKKILIFHAACSCGSINLLLFLSSET